MAKEKIRDFQVDLCDPEEPPSREKICPDCIPNPDAIVPDWTLSNGEPFLNPKTCEYQVAVLINQEGDYYRAEEIRTAADKGIDLETLMQSYVMPGLRIMLRYYEKEESDSLVCAFAPEPEAIFPTSTSADVAGQVATSAAIGFLWGGPLGALIMGGIEVIQESYELATQPTIETRENNITLQANRCKTIYKLMVEGVLPKNFHSQVTKKIEVTSGLPDGSTFNIVVPDPVGLLMYQDIGTHNKLAGGIDVTVKNPDSLELYARAVDYDFGSTPGEPMQVLIAIPSYVLDKVPAYSAPSPDDFDGPKNVVLPGPRIKAMLSRCSEALRVYGKYQAYWWQTERATLYQKIMLPNGSFVSQTTGAPGSGYSESSDLNFEYEGFFGNTATIEMEDQTDYDLSGDPQIFYIIKYQQAVVNFYSALHDLLEKNDFRLTAWPNWLGDRAEEVKLVFEPIPEPANESESPDGSNAGPVSGHFTIKSVWAKYRSCGWQKMKKGMGAFRNDESVKNQTVMGYIANLSTIDEQLRAKETPPWLDFIVEHTYPPLDVRYHSETNKVQGTVAPLGCILDGQGEAFRDWIFDSAVSLVDAVAYQFNKNACKLLTDPKFRPTEDKWAAWREQRQNQLNQVNRHYAEEQRQLRVKGQRISEKQYKNPLERQKDIESNVMAQSQSALDQAQALAHPYRSAAIDAALKEFDMDNSLIGAFIDQASLRKMGLGQSIWKNFRGTLGGSEQSKFEILKTKLDKCGLNQLMVKSIECLMGGVTLEAAYEAIIKAALKSMNNQNWEKLFMGIPYDKQVEIKDKIEKVIGDMPPPWEWAPGKNEVPDQEMKLLELDDNLKSYDKQIEINDAKVAALKERIRLQGKYAEELDKQLVWASNQESKVAIEKEKKNNQKDTKDTEQRIADIQRQTKKLKKGDPRKSGDKALSDLEKLRKNPEEMEKLRTHVERYNTSLGHDPDNRYEQGTAGKAFADIQIAIFDIYIDTMIEVWGVDGLLKAIEKLPGAKFIVNAIKTWDCPYPPLFSPPAGAFLESLSLSLCKGSAVGKLSFPKLMGLGNITFMNLLKVIWQSLLKAVIDTAFNMLVTMIVKILQILESAICKAIELAGKLVVNALTPGDQGGFMGAVADVFCGEGASDKDKEDTASALLSSLGVVPSDFSGMNHSDLAGSHADVMRTISSVSTRNELKNLMVMDPRDHDINTLRRISKAVSVVNPEYASIFSDPNNVSQLFASASNFLTPTQVKAIREELDAPEDDVPVDDSICLTKQQLDDWNRDRINLFTSAGLPEDLAKDWVQKQNDKAKSDLIEACSMAARGIDGPLEDELSKLTDFENAMGDPECQMKTSALSFRSPEIDAIDEMAASGVFKGLTKDFQRDLTGGGWLWGKYGVVDHILADKRGVPLRAHENRTRATFLYPTWANTQEEYDNKKDHLAESLGIPEDWIEYIFPEDASGVFPDTVGILVQESMKALDFNYSPNFTFDKTQSLSGLKERWLGIDYRFSYTKPAMKVPDLILEFRDNLAGDPEKFEYGFELKYHSFVLDDMDGTPKVSNRFDYDISLDLLLSKEYTSVQEEMAEQLEIELPEPGEPSRVQALRMRVPYDKLSSDQEEILRSMEIDDADRTSLEYTYEGLIWWKYCESMWAELGVTLPKDMFAKDSWGHFSSKMFSDVANMMMEPNGELPAGFNFGYTSDSAITFEDLLYVNPEATEDKSTWEYTYEEEEKVLGKSATDNPRVHFLDPEIHGGWYSWPKVYIERFEYGGVLSAIQLMVPDIDSCQPKKTDFLDWKYLANRQKEVRNKMIPDKRLSIEEECVKKIPFDLVQTNDIHGFIEASVLATIRTYVSEFILKALPTITSLEFNDENYDNAVASMIVEYMASDMPEQGSWYDWTWIKRYDYWLHFLEQSYQIVHRRIKMKELKPTAEMEDTIEKITEAQRRYVHVSSNVWEDLENTVHDHAIPYLKKKYPDTPLGTVAKRSITNPFGVHPFRGKSVLFLDGSDERPADVDYQIMKGATIIYFGKDADQITEYSRQRKSEYFNGFEFNWRASGFSKSKARRCAKLYTLHSMRNHAKKMLKHLVNEELKNYSLKIAETLKPAPAITSLSRYYIGASNATINGGLKSGKSEVERPIPATLESTGEEVITYIEDPGTCVDVSSDVLSHNPLDDHSAGDLSNGQFIVEKYVRIIDKPEDESADVPDFIKNRPDHLRGVVSIKEFRKFVNENMIDNPDFDPDNYNLSDLFGDAEILRDLSDRATGIYGSIGFKFGIRLGFVPPSGFVVPPPTPEALAIAQREKAYYLKESGTPNTKHIFPLVSFEKDILDDAISKIDWQDEHFGENFRCYVDNLVASPQFKVIFDNIFPLRRASSLVALYTYYGWLPAIGSSEEERDWDWFGSLIHTPGKDDMWKEDIFIKTKETCYRMFHGFYEADSWEWSWDWNFDFDFKLWFQDMMPKLFTNLDPSVRWWQRWRVEQNRPFDKDGEDCGNILGNLFSW